MFPSFWQWRDDGWWLHKWWSRYFTRDNWGKLLAQGRPESHRSAKPWTSVIAATLCILLHRTQAGSTLTSFLKLGWTASFEFILLLLSVSFKMAESLSLGSFLRCFLLANTVLRIRNESWTASLGLNADWNLHTKFGLLTMYSSGCPWTFINSCYKNNPYTNSRVGPLKIPYVWDCHTGNTKAKHLLLSAVPTQLHYTCNYTLFLS